MSYDLHFALFLKHLFSVRSDFYLIVLFEEQEEQGLTAYPKVSWMLSPFVPTYQVLWLQAYTTWLDFFWDEFCDSKDLEMASYNVYCISVLQYWKV